MNRFPIPATFCALALALAFARGVPSAHADGPAGSERTARPTPLPQNWAFAPLAKSVPPAVKDGSWPRTAVDRFVLGRLEAQGMAPAPAADRRTLVRRVFLDLLGIPPTPEEASAFVRDPASDDAAWASLVRRLLARPEHGERWARHWLDVARFAESSGFEHDYDRPHAYHYRDFVIRALNADMPYDRFVRWQLAGDEFEPDNPEALMATGFLGAGVFPTQITANEVERTRYDAMDDMLSTAGTAFLGLTVGCARCHDHKSDPISSREYYRMLATFTTTARSELELDLDPGSTRRAREHFDREHAPLTAALREEETQRLPARFEAWLAAGAPASTLASATWQHPDFRSVPPVSAGGATLQPQEDGSFLATGKNPDSDRYTFITLLRGEPVTALRLEALADPSLPKGGPGRADNGNFALSRIRVLAGPADGSADREIELRQPRATFEQNSNHLGIASSLDDNPRTGWAVDPRFGVSHAAAFEFATPVGTQGETRLTVHLDFEVNTRHQIGRPRIAMANDPRAPLEAPALPMGVASLLARLRADPRVASGLSGTERALLLDWWKPSDPEWRRLADAVTAHERQAPKPHLTKVLACVEGHTPVRMHTQGADFFPETYFLKRGSTDQKQGVASQGFLEGLTRASDPESRWTWKPPAGARFSGRRRSLALWMTDTEHGAGHLLARVAVNRLWQHHFGAGLVATPNDFGAQGARPSHPELLDWLAGELIRNGWRLRPIHELLLTSAAYRQAALSPSEAAADRARAQARAQAAGPACPEPGAPSAPSRPVASDTQPTFRGYPARRLEAEAIRDSILSVCGVLDPTRFGPGTLDEASTRRSIYFTIKRSRLIPAMQVFDAPEPLVSQGTRPATTVAPQALLLLNSPHVRGWASRFARRIAPDMDTTADQAVTRAYALALVRPPTDPERSTARGFLETQTTDYIAAGQPADQARHLALTDFAQAMLGLNEFLHVD